MKVSPFCSTVTKTLLRVHICGCSGNRNSVQSSDEDQSSRDVGEGELREIGQEPVNKLRHSKDCTEFYWCWAP